MSEYERAAMETANEYERRLITLAKQGDSKALDWLLGNCAQGRGLRAYLVKASRQRMKGCSDDDIDDVVSDVEVQVITCLHTFNVDSTLGTWAVSILNNVVKKFWEKNKKAREHFVDIHPDDEDDEPSDPLVNFADPDSIRPNALTRDEANRYFVQLSDGLESIIQRHFDAQTQEYLRLYLQNAITEEFDKLGDIAKQTGLTAGSADRARKTLAKLVKSQGLD